MSGHNKGVEINSCKVNFFNFKVTIEEHLSELLSLTMNLEEFMSL